MCKIKERNDVVLRNQWRAEEDDIQTNIFSF